MNGSSSVGPWLRHFSYMLAHQDAQHLWPNIVAQLALASVATAFRPAAASGAAGVILGQARVLAVYLLAVLGGGIAFTLVEVRPGYSQDFDFSDARKMTKNEKRKIIRILQYFFRDGQKWFSLGCVVLPQAPG